MDATILVRLGPALLVAWLVAQGAVRDRGIERREVTDELLRVLVVGLLAGRLAYLVLEPAALGATVSIAILVRAGVETGAAAVAAVALVVVVAARSGRHWVAHAAVPAVLAGSAAWDALCQVQGVCAGVPLDWGVRFPGRAFPAFPAGYVEAAVLAVLAVFAWRWRGHLARLLWLAAAGGAVRVAMGMARPVLGERPTRDQVWFTVLAVGLAAIASRLRAAPAPAGVAESTDEAESREVAS